MARQPCDVRDEEIVGFLDGSLQRPRRDLIRAHQQTCQHCRARIAAYQEVDQILRRAVGPAIDDPRARARIRQRAVRDGRTDGGLHVMRHVLSRPESTLLAVTVLTALILVYPANTDAQWPFFDGIRIQPFSMTRYEEGLPLTDVVEQQAREGPGVVAESAAWPFIVPESLPLDLTLIGSTRPAAGQLQLSYADEGQLSLLISLFEVEEGDQLIQFSPTVTYYTTMVAGTPVLWLPDPRPDSIVGAYWTHEGVLFELLVLEAPPGGFQEKDAGQIVAALLALSSG